MWHHVIQCKSLFGAKDLEMGKGGYFSEMLVNFYQVAERMENKL
jgi:hypothetical protein